MEPANGRSLHIGLNHVDPAHYSGWSGDLAGCEFDANDMESIAKSKGFSTSVLLTEAARSDAVLQEIGAAAEALSPGDIFFLTYSGHGGQVPDLNGDEDWDRYDETWVLYDRQLVDDELYSLWGTFATGVRVIVLSDSCHSGSVARAMFYEASPANETAGSRFKNLPTEIEKKTYREHQE